MAGVCTPWINRPSRGMSSTGSTSICTSLQPILDDLDPASHAQQGNLPVAHLVRPGQDTFSLITHQRPCLLANVQHAPKTGQNHFDKLPSQARRWTQHPSSSTCEHEVRNAHQTSGIQVSTPALRIYICVDRLVTSSTLSLLPRRLIRYARPAFIMHWAGKDLSEVWTCVWKLRSVCRCPANSFCSSRRLRVALDTMTGYAVPDCH